MSNPGRPVEVEKEKMEDLSVSWPKPTSTAVSQSASSSTNTPLVATGQDMIIETSGVGNVAFPVKRVFLSPELKSSLDLHEHDAGVENDEDGINDDDPLLIMAHHRLKSGTSNDGVEGGCQVLSSSKTQNQQKQQQQQSSGGGGGGGIIKSKLPSSMMLTSGYSDDEGGSDSSDDEKILSNSVRRPELTPGKTKIVGNSSTNSNRMPFTIINPTAISEELKITNTSSLNVPDANGEADGLSKMMKASEESHKVKKSEYSEHTYIYESLKRRVDAEVFSFGCIPPTSKFRIFCVKLVHHVYFERFILFIIILNTIIFAVVDYSHVDKDGYPVAEGSMRNKVYFDTNIPFVLIFTMEFVLKCIAKGMFGKRGSYFSDYWNWLDFLIVVAGICTLSQALQNISTIRCLRMIRPLRTINKMPSLRRLCNAILFALPNLGGVIMILGFIFVIYILVGIQIFSGPFLHTRCRSTPYPVNMSYLPDMGMDYRLYRCIEGTNFDLANDHANWKKEDSPWSTPQDCYWPVYDSQPNVIETSSSDLRFCSLFKSGNNHCTPNNIKGVAWCGSSFDALGNFRFLDRYEEERNFEFLALQYGKFNYDTFGNAFITIFTAITLEGWTTSMYQLMDSFENYTAIFFYMSLVFSGSFFALQLLLAVLEENFIKSAFPKSRLIIIQDKIAEERASALKKYDLDKDRTFLPYIMSTIQSISLKLVYFILHIFESSSNTVEKKMRKSIRKTELIASSISDNIANLGGSGKFSTSPKNNQATTTFSGAGPLGFNRLADGEGEDEAEEAEDLHMRFNLPINLDGVEDEETIQELVASLRNELEKRLWGCYSCVLDGLDRILEPFSPFVGHDSMMKKAAVIVVQSKSFEFITLVAILLNCIVLCLNHYPMTLELDILYDNINGLFSLFFIFDMILKMYALGTKEYFSDFMNTFDFFVVIFSSIDLISAPPVLFGNNYSKGNVIGVISLLRSFRLFRILKFALRFSSVKRLLNKIVVCFFDLGNFMILFSLFTVINALLGMQFFSNRFRFDAEGDPITDIYSDEWKNAYEISRNNFDDFSGALASVFQIVTTEGWTTILFSIWRSCGKEWLIFPFAIILVGSYILMNLYLAIILFNLSDKKQYNNKKEMSLEAKFDAKLNKSNSEKEEESNTSGKHNNAPDSKRLTITELRKQGKFNFTTAVLALTKKLPDIDYYEEQDYESSQHSSEEETKVEKVKLQKQKSSRAQIDKKAIKKARHKKIHNADLDESDAVFGNGSSSSSGSSDKDKSSSSSSSSGSDLDNSMNKDKNSNNADSIHNIATKKNLSNNTNATAGPFDDSHKASNAKTSTGGRVRLPSMSSDGVDDDGVDDNVVDNEVRSGPPTFLKRVENFFLYIWSWVVSFICCFGFKFKNKAPIGNKVAPENLTKGDRAKLSKRRTGVIHSQDETLKTFEVVSNNAIFPLSPERSLFLFDDKNAFRIFCANVISALAFENLMVLLIIVSSITIVMDNPLDDPESSAIKSLYIVDIIFTTFFVVECVMKIVATGFALQRNAYLRDGWNILDFVIVVMSLASIFSEGANGLNSFKAIRAMRALKPLRMIRRAPGLKVIVNAILASVPDVFNVFVVVVLMLSLFAVVSVNLLRGQLRSCQGDNFDNLVSSDKAYMDLLSNPRPWDDFSPVQQSWFSPNSSSSIIDNSYSRCIASIPNSYPDAFVSSINANNIEAKWTENPWPCCGNLDYSLSSNQHFTSKQICECWGSKWDTVTNYNFDSFPGALIAFFVISTNDDWVDLMYASVDSAGIDQQPKVNANQAFVYFYIVFMLVCNFFAINLFIGVLLNNFKAQKELLDNDHLFMTESQHDWIKSIDLVRKVKPVKLATEPKFWFSKICFRITNSKLFDTIILLTIFGNVMCFYFSYFGQSYENQYNIDVANTAFSVIFIGEAAIKIVGLRRFYFDSAWNIFDFGLMLGSIVGINNFFIGGGSSDIFMLNVGRVFRVFRAFRMIEGFRYSKVLLDTLLKTLPSLANITMLLILFIYIFAVIGIQLFAKVAYNGSYNEDANFRGIGVAMLSLMRFSTGENWGTFMFDVSSDQPGCVDDPSYNKDYCGFHDEPNCKPLNGCGSPFIIPYMVMFVFFFSICMFNLFASVIIDGFHEVYNPLNLIHPEDLSVFAQEWAKYDTEATGYIKVSDLNLFIKDLFTPYGLGGADDPVRLREKLKVLDLHVYNIKGVKKYDFTEVSEAIATDVFITSSHSAQANKSTETKINLHIIRKTELKEKIKSSSRQDDNNTSAQIDKDFTGEALTSNRIIAHEVVRDFLNKYKENRHKLIERKKLVRQSMIAQRRATNAIRFTGALAKQASSASSAPSVAASSEVDDLGSECVEIKKTSQQPDGTYIGIGYDDKLYKKVKSSDPWTILDSTTSRTSFSNNNSNSSRSNRSRKSIINNRGGSGGSGGSDVTNANRSGTGDATASSIPNPKSGKAEGGFPSSTSNSASSTTQSKIEVSRTNPKPSKNASSFEIEDM